MPGTAYIGIGSNLGDRFKNCQQAIGLLRENFSSIITSPCYETDPIPGTEGGPFLNGVVAVEASKSPQRLLALLQSIESKLGRVRTKKWGERTIDLDILLFGDQVIDAPELKIPHPELPRRRFVLQPLADLAPDLLHPILQKSVRHLLRECPDQGWVTLYQAVMGKTSKPGIF